MVKKAVWFYKYGVTAENWAYVRAWAYLLRLQHKDPSIRAFVHELSGQLAFASSDAYGNSTHVYETRSRMDTILYLHHFAEKLGLKVSDRKHSGQGGYRVLRIIREEQTV